VIGTLTLESVSDGKTQGTNEQAATLSVLGYEPRHAEIWEETVSRSCVGTMLLTRRFISYHGNRFRDRSLIVGDRRGKVVGVFPAAEDPVNPRIVVSHPGLTYGGLVHDGSVRGASMVEALEKIASHYRRVGYSRLRYKVLPAIYRSAPTDDDIYALFRIGAYRYRCDLSAAIDLSRRGKVSHSRPQKRRRAEAAGVSAKESWSDIAGFWEILEQNLSRRHGASPVHSLEEIRMLHDRFPDDILLMTAKIGGVLVGGILLFLGGPVMKAQYAATTEEGRATFALDPVTEQAIDLARERGCRFFDFGTATLDEGHSLNQDLYQFKVSFGAGGVVYEQYEAELH
jgi:hypothetical protein